MSESFYITLPSHSGKQEFPNKTSNHFKVRLPEPQRLNGSGWKVALSSISLPDPKNVLPSWMSGFNPLRYTSWFNGWKDNLSSKKFLSATFSVGRVRCGGFEQYDRCGFHENDCRIVEQAFRGKEQDPRIRHWIHYCGWPDQ